MKHARFAVVVAAFVSTAAAAPPRRPAPAPIAAWVGVFHPQLGAGICTGSCTVGGSVRVLASADGSSAPTGDVLVLQPVAGTSATGHLDHGVVAVTALHFDPKRDGETGVLVVPVGKATVVPATAAQLVAIRAVLGRDEALAGVKKALKGLEVGAVDTDGDGVADFAVTYGCGQWADGQCQLRGQFFLARRGATWVEIE